MIHVIPMIAFYLACEGGSAKLSSILCAYAWMPGDVERREQGRDPQHVPTGLIRLEDGRVNKTPDLQVQLLMPSYT